jgi:hypothetical protein
MRSGTLSTGNQRNIFASRRAGISIANDALNTLSERIIPSE